MLIGRPPNIGSFQARCRDRRQERSIRSTTRTSAPTTAASVVRAMARRALEQARDQGMPMNEQAGATKWIGSRSSGWRIRRWSPAAAALPATSISRASFTCGSCAPTTRTADIVSIEHRGRARCPAWSRCGPRRDIADIAADRFPRGADREARAVPPAGAGARTRCATSASRSRRCSPRTLTSPRTPPSSSPWRSRNCRRCSTPAASPANSRSAATPRRRSCTRATATSRRCSAARTPSSS